MQNTRQTHRQRMLQSYINKYNEIKAYILENAKVTITDYESSILNHPFFMNKSNCEGEDMFSERCNIETSLFSYMNSANFPLKLKMMYLLLNDSKKEVNIKEFTFISLRDVKEKSDNLNNIIDIGIYYMGMGHVCILGMDKNTKKFFFRHDGGSNGLEAEVYLRNYRVLNPSASYPDKMLSFDEVLEKIKLFECPGEINVPVELVDEWLFAQVS